MRAAVHRSAVSAASICAAALALLAPGALAMPTQVFTDPVGDNCREYTGLGTQCGPDITQVVFSLPADGQLHVDVSYASLPVSTDPQLPTQLPEFVDVGIYPPSATTPNLFAELYTYRVAQTSPGEWTLSSLTGGFAVIGTVTAAVRPLGIELAVPLNILGPPWLQRYAVNAGSAGATIPELPDLAPNEGLYSLVAEAPPPAQPAPATAPARTPATTRAAPRADIRSLRGIPANQRGRSISGTADVSVPGDLTVEARANAKKSKTKTVRIARVTRRKVKAGKVRFRLVLPKSARRKLAGRRTRVTLRVTLKPKSGRSVTRTRRVTLTVPR